MIIAALVKRNFKEIIRDPITLVFAIILPLMLLVLFQQFDIPSEIYNINNFAPSVVIFGYSFITLFTASLIAKDRTSSFLTRLFASPIKAYEYLLGYTLPLMLMALIQSILFLATAVILGLTFSFKIVLTSLILLPVSLLFIALGILIGCLVNDKVAPGVGSIVVQLVAFTSGMYFDINQVGGILKVLSKALPFSYSVDIARSSLNGTIECKNIIIVLTYIIILYIISSLIFKNKMT